MVGIDVTLSAVVVGPAVVLFETESEVVMGTDALSVEMVSDAL